MLLSEVRLFSRDPGFQDGLPCWVPGQGQGASCVHTSCSLAAVGKQTAGNGAGSSFFRSLPLFPSHQSPATAPLPSTIPSGVRHGRRTHSSCFIEDNPARGKKGEIRFFFHFIESRKSQARNPKKKKKNLNLNFPAQRRRLCQLTVPAYQASSLSPCWD